MATSSLRGAGNGLFTLVPVSLGIVLGYMGGIMRCADCVRARKLHRGDRKFTCIDCGVGSGCNGVDVRWYLCRSNNTRQDGVCWYINSRSGKRKRNCEMVCAGFDRNDKPVVYVKTFCDVGEDTELLPDYFHRK